MTNIWLQDESPSGGDLQEDIQLAVDMLGDSAELLTFMATELADGGFVVPLEDEVWALTPKGVAGFVALDGLIRATMREQEPDPWLYEGGMLTEALETLVERGYDRATVTQAFRDAGEEAVWEHCGHALDAIAEMLELGKPDEGGA